MRVKSSQTQTVSTGEGHGTWPQPLLSQESPSGTRACTHRYEGEPGRLRTLARGRQDTVREGVSGWGQLMWRANQGGPLGLLERGVRTCDHGLLLEATLALEPACHTCDSSSTRVFFLPLPGPPESVQTLPFHLLACFAV